MRAQLRATLLIFLVFGSRVADVSAERSATLASMRTAQLQRLLGEQLHEAANVFAGLEEELMKYHSSSKHSRTAGHRSQRGQRVAAVLDAHGRRQHRHQFHPLKFAKRTFDRVLDKFRAPPSSSIKLPGDGSASSASTNSTELLPTQTTTAASHKVCCFQWNDHESKLEAQEYGAADGEKMTCEVTADGGCDDDWVRNATLAYETARSEAAAAKQEAMVLAASTKAADEAAAKAAHAMALAAAKGAEVAQKERGQELRKLAEKKAAENTTASKGQADETQKEAEARKRTEKAEAKAAYENALAAADEREVAQKQLAQTSYEAAVKRASEEMEMAREQAEQLSSEAVTVRAEAEGNATDNYSAALADAEVRMHAAMKKAKVAYRAAVAQAKEDLEAARHQSIPVQSHPIEILARGQEEPVVTSAKRQEEPEGLAADEELQQKALTCGKKWCCCRSNGISQLVPASFDLDQCSIVAASPWMTGCKYFERCQRCEAPLCGKHHVCPKDAASPSAVPVETRYFGGKCGDLHNTYLTKKRSFLQEVRRIQHKQKASSSGKPSKLGLIGAGRLGRAFLAVTKAEEAAKAEDPDGSCGIGAADHEDLKLEMQKVHPCWSKVEEAIRSQDDGSEELKQEAFIRLTSVMLSCKEPSEEEVEAGKEAIKVHGADSEEAAEEKAVEVQAMAEEADEKELELTEGDGGADVLEPKVSLLEHGAWARDGQALGSSALASAGSDMLARAQLQVETAVERLGHLVDSGADAEAEALARALLLGESGDEFEVVGLIFGGILYSFAFALCGGATVLWFLFGWMVCIIYKALSFLVNVMKTLWSWASKSSPPTGGASIWGCYAGGVEYLSTGSSGTSCILMLGR